MPAAQGDIAVRHQLLERVSAARLRSDDLFNLVRADSIYERPIPERHRIIFYLGHLEAFDWNLLHENVLGLKSFQPELDRLFAFGIDPVGGGLPTDQPSDWPSLEIVRDYAKQIRAALDEKLCDGILESRSRENSSLDTLLNVAIEHRLMHVETLAYMLHRLPFDRKVRQLDPPSLVTPPVAHRMVEIPDGIATLGLARGRENFGWDNEFESHAVQVPGFAIDQYMVTNRQYLDFLSSGGYETRDLWSDDDWNWKTAGGVSLPAFWEKSGEKWLYRTMFERIPLPSDWPVYISHAEARHMHAGQGSRFRLKRNGIGPPMERRTEAKDIILGARNSQMRVSATSISIDGIPRQSMPIHKTTVPSACTGCWGMGGSGPRQLSLLFLASRHFRSIADIRLIFLMASTS